MLEKILYFLKRIFKFNSVKCLSTSSLAGINGSYEARSNFNLTTSQGNSNDLQLENFEAQTEEQIQDSTNGNLFSSIFNLSNNEEDFEGESQFQYDENKAKEMDKKIDYYKKDPDKLYLLSLNEILEINFYYEKRIQKLENINN